MLPPHDCNPTIRMWRWMANSHFLKLKMFKFFRLVILVIAMVLGNVEDEFFLFTLTFMKSKLRNWLTTHLDLVVKTYVQNFFIPKFPILYCYHWVEWRKGLVWVGAISCLCDIGLFGANFLILSILFVDRDFNTYVFCFVGLPSIDMAKSIYRLSSIPLEGKKGGGVL
jgi:hypothetical protein